MATKLTPTGWTVIFRGEPVLWGESYQVASNVDYFLHHPARLDNSECAEVAQRILDRQEERL